MGFKEEFKRMTPEEQYSQLIKSLPRISTCRLMAERYSIRDFPKDPLMHPALWRIGWNRIAKIQDATDKELEERWLKVAPPIKVGSRIDWVGIREKMYDSFVRQKDREF